MTRQHTRPAPPADLQRSGRTDLRVTSSLGDLAGAWDALAAAGDPPSPFLRSWWLAATAEGEPVLLVVARGRTLLGGLALQRDRLLGVERLTLLGSGPLCPDHLDLVAAPGEEDAVAGAVGEWLLRPGNRIVDLSGLAAHHRLGLGPGDQLRERPLTVAPSIDLTVDPDAYLASRPSRLRHTIERRRRKLVRAGARHRTHRDAATGLAALSRLHQERWARTSSLLPRFDSFAEAVRHGTRAGEVTFHELVIDDHVVASEVIFEVAGRASFYQSGRSMDPAFTGAGTVLKAAVVDSYREQGLAEYDLLRGSEAYKQEWATGERELVRLDGTTAISARCARAASRAATVLDRLRPRHESPGLGGNP